MSSISSTDCEDIRDQNQIRCVRSKLKEYLESSKNFEAWLSIKAPENAEPFYSSFDIRDAGFKLAPVDANLYPAGFNNVCPDDLQRAQEILQSTLTKHLGRLPKRVLILSEAHTKNRFYADHLHQLRQLFRALGIATEIGWWSLNGTSPESLSSDTPVELLTTDEQKIQAWPVFRENDMIQTHSFCPEFILLNNDFSSGYPKELDGIKQPIEPSPRMGWHSRKKDVFFRHYNFLALELAKAAGIDPWRLQVKTEVVRDVDFDEGIGMDRIALAVDEMIASLQKEYSERNISEQPFVFVKNNSGTYGMGILKVDSGQKLLELNRREKNKMDIGKNKLKVREVIVQEGIPTRYFHDNIFAEPVIYLIGSRLIGGFLRQNPLKGRIDNLNSQGMVFEKLCMSDLFRHVDRDVELELVYGVIAKLSMAAVAQEFAEKSEFHKGLNHEQNLQ